MNYIEYAQEQQEIDPDMEIFGGVKEEIIKEAESKLNVIFPLEYVTFLKECGSCGYPNSYISGLFQEWDNEESSGSTLHDTFNAREQHKLPIDYIVLEYAVDENYYLLKVSQDERLTNSEVFSVDIDSNENLGKFNKVFSSFEEYYKYTIEAQ
ncbi:SMI1/KNR4 family protein [Tenacibaculum maritimum]|uniref:SMI1/KNR4 family protein n=1 Tax=Tenacibaculum maritimum TaxID=107401 RepID=UPI003877756F